MCACSCVCHSTCLPSTHGGQRTRSGVSSQLPSDWPQELPVTVLHARLPDSRPEDLLVFSPCHRTTGSYTQNHWITHSEPLGHTLRTTGSHNQSGFHTDSGDLNWCPHHCAGQPFTHKAVPQTQLLIEHSVYNLCSHCSLFLHTHTIWNGSSVQEQN